MKPSAQGWKSRAGYVAPHAGAWIETNIFASWEAMCLVAPHAGAWIETWPACAWVSRRRVAPHAGAWIETLAPITVVIA